MIKDITIGQYYNGSSVVHKLDPRTKIILTLFYAITLFLCNSYYMILFAAAVLCIWILLSRVPVGFIFKGLKPVMVFIVFTGIFSIFNGDGRILLSVWKLRITDGSLMTTVTVISRLIFLILGSSVMTYTTKHADLSKGLEKLFGFLKLVGVPVSEMAMMMSIALRFIPIFVEELDKIMKAQLARGADFESKNIGKRIKSYVPVLVPLFVSAIRRAVDLANAMDSRCFNGCDNRSSMNVLKYGASDVVCFILIAAYTSAIIAFRF